MSYPHTGKLTARIRGLECTFDGDVWATPDATLTAQLNAATDNAAKTHHTIHELATKILRQQGLLADAEILSWENNTWRGDDQLPPGAID
jgi:hypothetical protein